MVSKQVASILSPVIDPATPKNIKKMKQDMATEVQEIMKARGIEQYRITYAQWAVYNECTQITVRVFADATP